MSLDKTSLPYILKTEMWSRAKIFSVYKSRTLKTNSTNDKSRRMKLNFANPIRNVIVYPKGHVISNSHRIPIIFIESIKHSLKAHTHSCVQ